MKKVFLFFAVAMIFASCAPKATETEEAVVEDTVVVADTVAAVVDSVATVATDSVVAE